MKRLSVVALAVFGLSILLCIPAEGAGCRTVHRCAPPVVVQSAPIVETVAVLPIVSAFLQPQVIAYGAAFVGAPYQQVIPDSLRGTSTYPYPPPPVPGAVPVGHSLESQSSLAILQRLEQRLGGLEQKMGVAPPQAQTAPMPAADAPPTGIDLDKEKSTYNPAQGQAGADVVKLFTARCASCHAKGREGSGGGFVLLDGPRLVSLSAAKQKDVLQRVYSTDPKRAMPRGGKPLSDEELSTVISWIATN